MNKEEKEAIETLKGLCSDDCVCNDIINIITKLIEKQQKEIEELKERNQTCIKESDLMNAVSFLMNRNDMSNYISKDKIKEKIEEIETLSMLDFAEKEKFDFKYTLDGIYCMQKGVVFILKELLGE